QLAGLRAGLKEFQRISKVADAYVKTLDLKKYPATAQRHAQLLAMVQNDYAKVVESEKRIGKLHVKRAVRVLKYEEVVYSLNFTSSEREAIERLLRQTDMLYLLEEE
ncbi:MAG: hypothetical protein ACRC5C_06140, partial [Bacilli bacterium]